MYSSHLFSHSLKAELCFWPRIWQSHWSPSTKVGTLLRTSAPFFLHFPCLQSFRRVSHALNPFLFSMKALALVYLQDLRTFLLRFFYWISFLGPSPKTWNCQVSSRLISTPFTEPALLEYLYLFSSSAPTLSLSLALLHPISASHVPLKDIFPSNSYK